jgi:hypothetical protein
MLGDAHGARALLNEAVSRFEYRNAAMAARGHLMELDAKDGDRAAVVRQIDAIAIDRIPLFSRTPFKLSIGRAFKILGDRDEAVQWLTQALSDAERIGHGKYVFEIEEELDGLLGHGWRKHRSTPMSAAADVPLHLPPIVAPAEQPRPDPSRQNARTPTC